MSFENQFKDFVEEVFTDLQMNLHVFMSDFYEETYGEAQHGAILHKANEKWTFDFQEQLMKQVQENVKLKFYSKISENKPFGFKLYLDRV